MKPLYFLPHYDDEIFVIPKISKDIAEGRSPVLIFFMSSSLRLAESVRFLKSLGVKEENIIFLGENLQAPDGDLLRFLPKFHAQVTNIFGHEKDHIEIVCPAYEGGHHDHDTISLLARVLAYEWGGTIQEFFLYHGHGTIGKIYRVSSRLGPGHKKNYTYTLKDYLALLKVPFIYKSQMSAMVGLWPFLFVKSIFSPLKTRLVSGDLLKISKHNHTPLYERWKRTTEKQFLETAKGFQEVVPVLESVLR